MDEALHRGALERVAGRLGMTTWSVALVGWLSAATAGVTALAVLATTGTLPGSGAWFGAPAPTVVPHAPAQESRAPSAVAQPAPVPPPAGRAATGTQVLVPVAVEPGTPAVAPVVVRLPRVVVALPVDEGGLEAPVIYEDLPVVQGSSTRVSVGVNGARTPTVLVERGLPQQAPANGSATGSSAGKTTTVGSDTRPPATMTGSADPSLVGKVVDGAAAAPRTSGGSGPVVVTGTQVANRKAEPTPVQPGDVVVPPPAGAPGQP